jgi:osmotically-inducible protein OsmY
MSASAVASQREDSLIQADIDHLIATYPPLAKDRRAIHVTVENGVITVSGHVQTANTRRYLLDHLAVIEGVSAVYAEHFYDDLGIRLDVSKVIPLGIQANVRYGAVILSGEPPQDVSIEDVADRVLAVPGVVKVISGFGG